YQYDKDNRKIKTIYPDGGIERFYYDSQGNLIKHITPEYYNIEKDDGEGYTFKYNNLNQLTTIIDTEGKIQKSLQYDLYGRITQEKDQEEITTLYKYNQIGIIEKRVAVDKEEGKTKYQVTRYQYDLNGNKITEKHGKEVVGEGEYPKDYHQIDFSYDKNNRLIQVKDKFGAKTEYKYNSLNQKTYESFRINQDTNKTIHYKYDETGALIEKKEEISSSREITIAITKFKYDKNNNIIEITTPKGHQIKRVYDKINRVIEEYQRDQESHIHRKYKYQYDKAGNIIKMINNTNPENIIQKEYKYDAKNRITHEINQLGNTTRIYYDKNDRVIKEIQPEAYNLQTDDGMGITYKYNPKGQVIESRNEIGEIISKNEYDPKGNIKARIDGSGSKVEYTYNLLGQIKEITTPNSRKANKALQKYTYDGRGNITGIEDGNGNTTTYKLDDWGRITEITNPEGGVEKYTYDFAGNITSTTDANGNT
ncbi:sugar-binding protein, partial [Alkaliphilus transvaalensis]|uniref:sugar-binding protein n=1 Tax=Alkaliphilus transvaalensis TaxID=114628 RepID=UPI0005565E45